MSIRIHTIGTWTYAVRLENVELPESDVAILHGPNGWGKTSLFRSVENVAAAFSGTLRPLPFDAFDAGSVRFSDGITALFMRFGGQVRIGISQPRAASLCLRCRVASNDCTCLHTLVVTYDSAIYDLLTRQIRHDEFLEPDAYRDAWWERVREMWNEEANAWRSDRSRFLKDENAWEMRREELYDGYQAEPLPEKPQFELSNWHRAFLEKCYEARNLSAHRDSALPSKPNLFDGFRGEQVSIPFVSVETSGTPFEIGDRMGQFPHTNEPSEQIFLSSLAWHEQSATDKFDTHGFLDMGRRMSVTFSRVDRVQVRCAKPIEVDLRMASGSRDTRRTTLQARPGSYEACQVLISDRIKRAASVLQHSVGIELLADSQGLRSPNWVDENARFPPGTRSVTVAVDEAESVNLRYKKLARFGLVTAPDELNLDPALDDEAAVLIFHVLKRDRARLELLMPEYRRLDFFQQFMSRGLRSRELTFSVGRDFGFRIEDKHGRLVPPWELSSGNQHRLSIAISALFETNPGGVLLIDEPELSLDVSWQRALVTDLAQMARLSGCQILLSTHSPVLATGHVDLLVPRIDAHNSDEIGAE